MPESRKTPRVLVIEDEMMVAMGLEMALEDAGYDVVGPVGNLTTGLEAARGEAISLALLDINVRGEQVFPLADVLAERGIPFAFLTGYGREVLPPRFATAATLAKPFHQCDLLATVASLAQ